MPAMGRFFVEASLADSERPEATQPLNLLVDTGIHSP
jgi:hypothetical protein